MPQQLLSAFFLLSSSFTLWPKTGNEEREMVKERVWTNPCLYHQTWWEYKDAELLQVILYLENYHTISTHFALPCFWHCWLLLPCSELLQVLFYLFCLTPFTRSALPCLPVLLYRVYLLYHVYPFCFTMFTCSALPCLPILLYHVFDVTDSCCTAVHNSGLREQPVKIKGRFLVVVCLCMHHINHKISTNVSHPSLPFRVWGT